MSRVWEIVCSRQPDSDPDSEKLEQKQKHILKARGMYSHNKLY